MSILDAKKITSMLALIELNADLEKRFLFSFRQKLDENQQLVSLSYSKADGWIVVWPGVRLFVDRKDVVPTIIDQGVSESRLSSELVAQLTSISAYYSIKLQEIDDVMGGSFSLRSAEAWLDFGQNLLAQVQKLLDPQKKTALKLVSNKSQKKQPQ